MPSLTRDEARARAAVVAVDEMIVDLDLTLGEEQFGSRTRIEFRGVGAGTETFADLRPVGTPTTVRLNGIDLDPALLVDGRLALSDLRADNVLEVECTMAWSRDGQGLHRSVDPADGEAYVYGHLFLDAAPRVFACFDQPDLKAPYTVSVLAPPDWVVVGNGAQTRVGPQGRGVRWALARTKPLATYFVTVCAGPYVAVSDSHDDIPLGIYSRRSLRAELQAQAPQMFEVTKASFDHYHSLFGIRYPFGKYDQVFVPEFNAGAMENPGCVTFRDPYLFRGAAPRDQILVRSNTIAHEMAHMWFGDLVTMAWWDDLWLNESFAEYMAYRTLTEATDFSDAWVEFSIVRKMWGYAAERSPSTHPVAGSPAPDALSALQNFDGISYAKGASVLRQLIAHIGDDAFVAGVTAYLREHAFGNGELRQFLGAMEAASGRDLKSWSAAWLETAGADTIATELGGHVLRETPPDHPADRAHTFDVAGWTDGVETFRVPLTITQERSRDEALAVAPPAAFVVPNASDLTWADVELAAASLNSMAEQLQQVPDPLARAVAWSALLGGVAKARVDPRLALDVFTASATKETNDSLLSRVGVLLTDRIVRAFLPPEAAESALGRISGVGLRVLRDAQPGSSRAINAARLVARTTADEERLEAWLAGQHLPEGLEGDVEFRWIVAGNLAGRGLLDEVGIETVRRADDTLSGRLSALEARAAIPDPASKGWAWTELTTNPRTSNYEALALARGFWVAPDQGLVAPYVARYPEAMVRMQGWMGDDALSRVVSLAFPGGLVTDATAAMSGGMLARTDLTPGVRRALVDAVAAFEEARRSRAAFG